MISATEKPMERDDLRRIRRHHSSAGTWRKPPSSFGVRAFQGHDSQFTVQQLAQIVERSAKREHVSFSWARKTKDLLRRIEKRASGIEGSCRMSSMGDELPRGAMILHKAARDIPPQLVAPNLRFYRAS
jgi:hypothetical protein